MKVSLIVSSDDKHCLQSSFRMVAEAFTGVDPGSEAADRLTGYVEERGTWQFRAMLAFAQLDLEVIDHEKFDTQEFLRDPENAIRMQVQDDTVAAQNIADTDLKSEVSALRQCVASPKITFIESVPKFEDLRRETARGRLIICNVNSRILEGQDGHMGHFVVVEAIDDDVVTMHNPSPPGRYGVRIPTQLFYKAWTSPSDTMANYLSIGRSQL